MDPAEQTRDQIAEVNRAVHELQTDIQGIKGIDPAKYAKISEFLDTHEETFNQPLVQAGQRALQAEADVTELKETLETQNVEAGAARERIDALELEIATRNVRASSDPEEYKQSPEYQALNEYCRRGWQNLPVETQQLLRTDNDAEGGFLAPEALDTEILKQVTEIDPMRSICRVRTVAGKSLNVPIRTTLPTAVYEGEQETGTDSVQAYASETLTPFRQTFTGPATMDMLMDAAFDMEAEIASDAAIAFAFGEGANFVNGTGFKQPEGFAVNATVVANEVDIAATVLAAEDVIDITGALKEGYNPVYVLNRRTLADLRQLRAGSGFAADDGTGAFLWMPGFQDRSASGPVGNTLNGFPYIIANSMDDIATTNTSLAFGDFRRGYTIVDRTGLAVIRDDLTLKKRAIVEFTFHRWNTGQVVLAEAITQVRHA